MYFEQQLALAHQELTRCSIQSSNSHPITFQVLHWSGLQAPLPHYGHFKIKFSIFFAWYSLIFAIIFILAEIISDTPITLISAVFSSLFAGLTAGISMATYYYYSAKRFNLSLWQQLK
ncbi:hypothetical protein SKA34_15235 [Photobacterium sp. SKA34]|uniref:DUF6404 family protein n=1 Tax=Photobacterium sp. SKA34 TaxID=121723 RepID=UPI00006B7849|nr:DUF6404 family protein [Photobacterium sp. SKA34]EAR55767.1 hypothetical protein SKA34_15235 [Photobacterium sp. SKA34]